MSIYLNCKIYSMYLLAKRDIKNNNGSIKSNKNDLQNTKYCAQPIASTGHKEISEYLHGAFTRYANRMPVVSYHQKSLRYNSVLTVVHIFLLFYF